MRVELRYQGQLILSLRCYPRQLFGHLKAEIERLCGLSARLFRFSPLSDSLTDADRLPSSDLQLTASLDTASLCPLRVCPLLGSPATVAVRLSDRVRDIKDKVKLALAVEEVALVQNGREWTDDQMVSDVYVPGQHCVDLLLPGDIVVKVLIAGTIYRVSVSPSDTVAAVKKRIEKRLKVSCIDRELLAGDIILSDNDCFSTITSATERVVSLADLQCPAVWVTSVGKPPIQVTFGHWLRGYPINLYNGRYIDQFSLLHYFRNGEILKGGERKLCLLTTMAEKVEMMVTYDVLIRDVKEEVAERLKVPIDSFTLVFDGEVLEDSYKLSEYSITDSSTVDIIQDFDDLIKLQFWGSCTNLYASNFNATLFDLLQPFYQRLSDLVDYSMALVNNRLVPITDSLKECGCFPGAVVVLVKQSEVGTEYLPLYTSSDTFYLHKFPEAWRLHPELRRILKSHSTLCYCADRDKDEVEFQWKIGRSWQLVAEGETCYRFRYEDAKFAIPFAPHSPIAEVRRRVQAELSLSRCVLINRGKVLDDQSSLQSVKGWIDIPAYDEFFICLKTLDGNEVIVKLPSADVTVEAAKGYCASGKDFTMWFYRGQRLEDHKSFRELGIPLGGRIIASKNWNYQLDAAIPQGVSPFNKFTFIKMANGTVHLIRFNRDDNCKVLIAGIANLLNLAPSKFVLIYNKKKLEDYPKNPIHNGRHIDMLIETDKFITVQSPDGTVRFTRIRGSATIERVRHVLRILPTHHIALEDCIPLLYCTLTELQITPCTLLREMNDLSGYYVIHRPGLCSLLKAGEGISIFKDLNLDMKDCCAYIDDVIGREDTPITPRSSIWLLSPADLCIHVLTLQKRSITLYFQRRQLLSQLKSTVSNKLRINDRNLRFVFNSEILTDDALAELAKAEKHEHSLVLLRKNDQLTTVTTSLEEVTALFSEGDTLHEKKCRLSHIGLRPLQFTSLRSRRGQYYYLQSREEVVELRHSASGERFTVIAADCLPRAVQEAAAERLGVGVERVALSWVGELLPQRLISDYELIEDTELIPVADTHKNTVFNVELIFADRTDAIRLFDCSTVASMKTSPLLCQCTGLYLHGQKFTDKDILRRFDGKLRVYCVTPGTSCLYVHISKSEVSAQFIVPHTATLLDVETMIERETGIGIPHQRLLYQGRELSHLPIGDEMAEITLEPIGDFAILVLTSGSKVCLAIDFTLTVGALKCIVQERTGVIPQEQRLLYKDTLLEDSQTLDSCGLRTSAIINLLTPNDSRIYIKSLASAPMPVYFPKSQTIEHLAEEVIGKPHSPLRRVRLFGSFELRGQGSLSVLRKPEGYYSFDLHISDIEEDDVLVFVKDCPALPKPLWVRKTHTLAEVQKAVGRTVGKEVAAIKWKGRTTDGRQLVKDSGLKMFSAIRYF